ncbi:MAG TPA: hypothetical protein VFP59_09785 [Candidatus Angelobacter sp.]|nr:hypothetical protein [Candidatus Angelobacter sp.]HEX5435389.1 hypothetical protein [Candidatus Angelobacter sp.]
MQADRVELSWDDSKSKWMVRIQVGEEVIRRYCDLPRSADEASLQQAAKKTLKDEGFEPAEAVIPQRAAS